MQQPALGECELSLIKRRAQVILIVVLLVVGLSIELMVHVNVQEKRDRALIEAVKSGDTRMVKALLDQGADANAREFYSRPHSAAENLKALWNRLRHQDPFEDGAVEYRLSALETLLAARRDTDARPPPENVELARALLAHGADPNVQTVPGTTPLMRAICFQQDRVVRLLLARGAKPSPLSLGNDPLLTYCSSQTASLLIQRGVPFDTPDSKGRTPLMSACDLEKNRPWEESEGPVTLFLLSDRIDPSIDPCIKAPSQPNVEVLTPMVLAGANMNARDNRGWTALMIAAHNCDMPRLRILVEAGADLFVRDQQGKTALDHTRDCWEGNLPEIEVRTTKGKVRFRVRAAGDRYVTTDEYRGARNFLWKASSRQRRGMTHLAPK
jgi:ankyrin repeat protein